MLYVLILVCGTQQTVCDTSTARAYAKFRAPDGFIVCGLPAVLPLDIESLGAGPGEELHIRCTLGN